MASSEFVPEPFQYEPLPTPTSIRIADIIRRPEATRLSLNGIPLIEIVLRTVDLADCPCFKALSYTWGSPYREDAKPKREGKPDEYGESHKLPLSVNGRLFHIRKNLHDALHQLLSSTDRNGRVDHRLPPYGKTLLVRAAEAGHLPLVTYYLIRGDNVNAQDNFGETALHYAAANGHFEVVRILLSYGANPILFDTAGQTPLDCAKQRTGRQCQMITELLLESYPIKLPLKKQGVSAHGGIVIDTFWIDSVCINQSDVAERNTQVTLMTQIFRSAASVRIWLGIADEKTKVALLAASVDEEGERQRRGLGPRSQSLRAALPSILHAETEIRRRAWFNRRWVIQECCISRTHEIYCGDLELNLWETENPRAAYKESTMNFAPLHGSKMIDLKNLITRYLPRRAHLNCASREGVYIPPLLHLSDIVKHTWGLKSEDPRDSIFALLSLAMPMTTRDGRNLVADYTKSTAEVFIEVARLFMEDKSEGYNGPLLPDRMEGLEILSFVQHQSDKGALITTCSDEASETMESNTGCVPGLPSWVPRFHQDLDSTRIYRHTFFASGEESEMKVWPSDTGSLKISGCHLDTIAEVEPRAARYSASNISSWLKLAAALSIPDNETDTTRLDVLWRTLITDELYGMSIESLGKHPFRTFLRDRLRRDGLDREEWERDLRELASSKDAHLVPIAEEIKRHQLEPDFNISFKSKLGWYYKNRYLWLTHRWGRLGLGPRQTRAGDQVWLLSGGCTPFVLRPIHGNESFQFVGECYVHGWMHGEAAPGGTGGGQGSWEPIEIR